MKECIICGKPNSHMHHRVFRSECKPLEHCKANLAYLCYEHHQGTQGVHGKHGEKLNRKLKLEFQKYLREIFTGERYTLEEIEKKLGISTNSSRSLSKLMQLNRGTYDKETIIRACMGGKIYD
ncbi:hypothetical protein [Clostridium algidicarnis]|uniref:hypothetical protein n=1 Tax=Clostridium algidicarnis TaxID=37659 RepID=UPI001C0D3138|nr:hypothetical protein [Clostridium algidicarnis]MBU3205166.1 hypothetical protein [Clostridium algidicarnis]MBU3213319.1 hypothetical protein [Clostridium algidicarnis]MBU3223786.1 hypothetical protein [Clostridium algidicarnis]